MATERLYLITRADLPPGSQAVQACHAARQFAAEHSEAEKQWFAVSNTLALLAVPDEGSLARLACDAERSGLRLARFHEPDLGGALTAIALEPAARRLCRRLSLALDSDRA